MINLAPQNAVCFEMSGYLVWDGTTYNFDERHTDKAIQANIMRCKYLMYKELSRYYLRSVRYSGYRRNVLIITHSRTILLYVVKYPYFHASKLHW